MLPELFKERQMIYGWCVIKMKIIKKLLNLSIAANIQKIAKILFTKEIFLPFPHVRVDHPCVPSIFINFAVPSRIIVSYSLRSLLDFIRYLFPSFLNHLRSRSDSIFVRIVCELRNGGSRRCVRPLFLSWTFSFPCFFERRRRILHYVSRKWILLTLRRLDDRVGRIPRRGGQRCG